MKNAHAIVAVLIPALLLTAGCGEPTCRGHAGASGGIGQITPEFTTAIMYWTGPEYLLLAPWYAVVAGTVCEFGREDLVLEGAHSGADLSPVAPPSETREWTTLTVERVLFVAPEAKEALNNAKHIRITGLSERHKGDKIVVFIDKYDPDGIVRKAGTNCPVGVRVKSWKDPVVEAVEALKNDESLLPRLLENPKYRRLWEQVDPQGLREYEERLRFLHAPMDP